MEKNSSADNDDGRKKANKRRSYQLLAGMSLGRSSPTSPHDLFTLLSMKSDHKNDASIAADKTRPGIDNTSRATAITADSNAPPEFLFQLQRYLEQFVSNVDVCTQKLLDCFPSILEKELLAIERMNYGYEYASVINELLSLWHQLFFVSKETLYYIACRIVLGYQSCDQVLSFTLKPQYEKVVMEPLPCSLRFHNFIEGLRMSMDSDRIKVDSKEYKPKGLSNTENWLKNHLLPIVLMFYHVIMNATDAQQEYIGEEKREDLVRLVKEKLERIAGNKRAIKMFAFEIMDSSFMDIVNRLRPIRCHKSAFYIKEAYHLCGSQNPELVEQGKRREAAITHFEALIAFYIGEQKNAVEKAQQEALRISANADLNWIRIETEEKFKYSFLESRFQILIREISSILSDAKSERKISHLLLLPPIQNYVEVDWAVCNVFSRPGPSRREYKIGSLKLALKSAPEEALYYLAHRLCKDHCYSYVWKRVISIRKSKFAKFLNNSYEEQYLSFTQELRRMFGKGEDARLEQSRFDKNGAIDLMRKCFIPVLDASLIASMWSYICEKKCIQVAHDILNGNEEDILLLAEELIHTSSILDVAELWERRMENNEIETQFSYEAVAKAAGKELFRFINKQ